MKFRLLFLVTMICFFFGACQEKDIPTIQEQEKQEVNNFDNSKESYKTQKLSLPPPVLNYYLVDTDNIAIIASSPSCVDTPTSHSLSACMGTAPFYVKTGMFTDTNENHLEFEQNPAYTGSPLECINWTINVHYLGSLPNPIADQYTCQSDNISIQTYSDIKRIQINVEATYQDGTTASIAFSHDFSSLPLLFETQLGTKTLCGCLASCGGTYTLVIP